MSGVGCDRVSASPFWLEWFGCVSPNLDGDTFEPTKRNFNPKFFEQIYSNYVKQGMKIITCRNNKTFGWRVIILGFMLSAIARLGAQPDQSSATVGDLVDVGGHKLFIQCEGPTNATPIVIFEAGGGGTSKDWSRVRGLLSDCRTCVYDRAGSGRSEPGPAPRTMHQEAFELHELLKAAKITGPIVLVGQSLGGLLNRIYAEQYGSNIVGLVLVDPTHESSVLANVRYGGWVRLREKAVVGRVVPEPRREGKASEYKPEDDYMAEEFQQIYLSRKANPKPLGNRPLIVIGAGKRPQPPGTSDEKWKELRQERDELVRDLAHLSGNSKFILAPTSGHAIHNDDPELVAHAIREVLEAASKGISLEGSKRLTN